MNILGEEEDEDSLVNSSYNSEIEDDIEAYMKKQQIIEVDPKDTWILTGLQLRDSGWLEDKEDDIYSENSEKENSD